MGGGGARRQDERGREEKWKDEDEGDGKGNLSRVHGREENGRTRARGKGICRGFEANCQA